MPPLSLGQPGASSNGGGGGAGTGTRTSRSKSRSWSVGSGDVGGVATGPLSSNAAATAAIAELGIVAGGAGWFSEGALAELVRTLPAPGGDDSRGSRGDAKIADAVADCEEKSLDAMEECEEVPKTGSTADGGHGPAAADAWCGAGRWPLGAIDCVEEALEQVRGGVGGDVYVAYECVVWLKEGTHAVARWENGGKIETCRCRNTAIIFRTSRVA